MLCDPALCVGRAAVLTAVTDVQCHRHGTASATCLENIPGHASHDVGLRTGGSQCRAELSMLKLCDKTEG